MSLKPAGELAQELILLFFFSNKKGKILSITDCPNKFLMGTQDTQKKSDVNNFLTISSAKIPLIPFSNSEISQLRPFNL